MRPSRPSPWLCGALRLSIVTALTPRQLDVLRTYGTTWDRRETARRLGISEAMVRGHLAAVHRRLDVTTTGEVYLRLGWLQVPAEDLVG